MRRAPPLSAVEAFVAAAETGTLRAAAAVLGLSAPSVTRRLQVFERRTGQRMFDRHSNGVELTAAGRDVLARLGPALASLKAAVAPDEEERPIRIRVSRSLAALWLLPRLARWRGRQMLQFEADQTLDDLRAGNADVGIFFGEGSVDGLIADVLIPIVGSAVGVRGFLNGDAGSARPSSLRVLGLSSWRDCWRTMAPEALEIMRFDGILAMYESAASGVAVAPGLAPLVEPYLADGRLVELPRFGRRPLGAYRLFASRAALRRRPVAAFRDWLLAEATRS